MATPLTLPIARLRSADARVSTLAGHDPLGGTWSYSVTPPAAFTMMHLVRHIQSVSPEVSVMLAPDGERILIHAKAMIVRGRLIPSPVELRRVQGLMAATLHALADKIGA